MKYVVYVVPDRISSPCVQILAYFRAMLSGSFAGKRITARWIHSGSSNIFGKVDALRAKIFNSYEESCQEGTMWW